jgi:catechol 2,3-dioxygenase-like lactoylglutathione lyase family enzyme
VRPEQITVHPGAAASAVSGTAWRVAAMDLADVHDMLQPAERDRKPLVDGICEVTLQTRDRSAMEAFYASALGLELLSRDDDRTWLTCGPRARLGLWTPGEKEFGDEGGRHVHFAFSVAPGELDRAGRRLRELGIDSHGPVEHPGGDRSLYFEDPAGNVVELWDFFRRGDGAAEGVQALASSED